MPAPLIAMGVAAGAQALSNIIGSSMQADAARQAQKGASKAASKIAEGYEGVKGAYGDNASKIDEYGKTVSGVYDVSADSDAVKKYKELMGQDLSKGEYTAGKFSTDKTLDDYYDKAWKLNNQTQLDALEASASNAGKLYSSGLLNQMASTASANASKAYKDAMEAYLKEKGIDVDIWKGEEANKQAEAQQYLNKYKTQMDTLGNYVGTGIGLQGDILGAQISNTNDSINTYTNYLTNYAQQMAGAGSYNPSTQMGTYANPNVMPNF